MDIQRPASVARQKKMRRIWMAAAAVLASGSCRSPWRGSSRRRPPSRPHRLARHGEARADGAPGARPGHARPGGRGAPLAGLVDAGPRRADRAAARRPGDARHGDPRARRSAAPAADARSRDPAARRRSRPGRQRARLDTERLNQRSIAATVEADYEQARLEREVNEDLARDGLVSNLILKQSTVRSESLRTRSQLEKERVAVSEESVRAQLLAQQARVDQLRTLFQPPPAAGRRPAGARRHDRRAGAGAGRSRPAGGPGHQRRPGRRPDPAQGGAAHRRDAGARSDHRPGRRRSTPATASSPARSSASTRRRRTARSPSTSSCPASCRAAPGPT